MIVATTFLLSGVAVVVVLPLVPLIANPVISKADVAV
jgi:hypothetical protein